VYGSFEEVEAARPKAAGYRKYAAAIAGAWAVLFVATVLIVGKLSAREAPARWRVCHPRRGGERVCCLGAGAEAARRIAGPQCVRVCRHSPRFAETLVRARVCLQATPRKSRSSPRAAPSAPRCSRSRSSSLSATCLRSSMPGECASANASASAGAACDACDAGRTATAPV